MSGTSGFSPTRDTQEAGPMTWPSALEVVTLVAAWLLLPGLAVGLAAGLRGLVAWGAAPVLSVGLVSGSAVAGGMSGVRWGAAVPVAATVLVAGAAFV
ncbi:MAG: hypothetical protein M3235_11410, partial [Actinomycetota bacterium]|nr:hypothetical protein [Actinomycetota bacterium]